MASAKNKTALFYDRRGQLVRSAVLLRVYSHVDIFERIEAFSVGVCISDEAFFKACGIASDAAALPCLPETRRFWLIHDDGLLAVYQERS